MKECYIYCIFGLQCFLRICFMLFVEFCYQLFVEREFFGEDVVFSEVFFGLYVVGEIFWVLFVVWFVCLFVDFCWFYIIFCVCNLDFQIFGFFLFDVDCLFISYQR